MKIIATSLLFVFVLWGAPSVDQQIAKTRQQIVRKEREIKKINSILESSGRQIKEQQQAIKEVDAKREKLEGEVMLLEGHKQALLMNMNQLKLLKTELMCQKEEIEKKLVKLVARDLSFSAVVGGSESLSEEDLIREALYKQLRIVSKNEIERLKHEYLEKERAIRQLGGQIKQIKGSIAVIEKKEEELVKVRKDKERMIAKLGETTKAYQAKLERLLKEQEAARATLEQLKVLKKRQLKPAPKEVQASAAASGSETIKMFGSSYLQVESGHYSGPKVDAPIAGATVVKSFGPYTDPVYNIRIHNDYVMLRSKEEDVTVHAVLDGRVVYAKEVPSLGRVVILEHRDGLATIYAHLAKIAPTMSIGKRVSRGEVVGRIGRELMFEVTKNGMPVNPLELITLK